jgi:hypothetical protein
MLDDLTDRYAAGKVSMAFVKRSEPQLLGTARRRKNGNAH